jgi:type IV pilus assembly protein PilA
MKKLKFSFNWLDDWLLELMLSILIIGLVIAAAVPIYATYIEKTLIIEAVGLMTGAKTDVAEYYSIHGQLPSRNEQLSGIKTAGRYTTHITVENGVLTGTIQHNDLLLSFRPALPNHQSPKAIAYVCGYAKPPNGFIVQGDNKTNIPAKYLTLTCR